MSFTQFETTDKVIDDRMNLFGNELISQITKYSTYDLYLKAGNLMNTQKPTGTGSLVTFSNVTETEQLAFTFNYAIPEQLIISKDNRYNMVIPFEGLESNRSYIFRYLYTHEGTTIFDITRNAVTAATGRFTAEFQALNQNATDITAEANSTVTLRIYVRTVAGTDAQISLLVNDVNALGRLSRNEATAVITTDNVYEGDKTQETINAEFALDIGQLSFKGALLRKTSVQSISNALFNYISWNSEVYDDLGFFDTFVSNTRFKIPTGVSMIKLKAGVSFDAVSVGSRSLEIINETTGDIVARGVVPATTHITSAYLFAESPVIGAIAEHEYNCRFYQNSGNAINVTITSSFFSVEVIN